MSLFTSIINNVLGQTVSDSTKPYTANVPDHDGDSSSNGTGVTFQRDTLEWTFIDFSKAERSPIFDVDPVTLKKFIGHNVTVVNRSRLEYRGCCLAIDPVSLSVILANRGKEGAIRVTTLPGYYLSTIKVDSDSIPAENTISVNDLDVAELYHAPTLYTETSKVPPPSPPAQKNSSPPPPEAPLYTPEELLKRKESLIELLKKHHMPITVKDAILELPGGIQISPPYTINQCSSGNPMIRKKLGEVMNSS